MEYEITNVEIVDGNEGLLDEVIHPSNISVLVEIELLETIYYLDFQTGMTFDYETLSAILWPYDGTEDYDNLQQVFPEDSAFIEFVEQIKRDTNLQEIWADYINEYYILDEEDGDDNTNQMKRRYE